jgi:Ferredoxin-like domain in Api92-like protein
MPNWIINRLLTKGDPQPIRNFLEVIKSEVQLLDFERIIPSPEILRHVGRVASPVGPWSKEQYFIDETHWRDFTAKEEKELEDLGYRSWRDWCRDNWGTDRNAFEVELDESTVDLGYVVISFETAWSPPARVLERLREMFPDIAFGCDWYPEDEFFYRYHPGQSTAIARSDQEQPGEHITATLYQTKTEYPDFFLETLTIAETEGQHPQRSVIEPMTPGEAHRWMSAPDVKLLALLYPELPKRETGRIESPTRSLRKQSAQPGDQDYPDIPF